MDILDHTVHSDWFKTCWKQFYFMITNITPRENPWNKIKFPEIKIIISCRENKKNFTMAGRIRKISPWLILNLGKKTSKAQWGVLFSSTSQDLIEINKSIFITHSLININVISVNYAIYPNELFILKGYLSQWAIYPNELFIPMSYLSQLAIYSIELFIPMSYLFQRAIYPNELFIPMSYNSQWAIYPYELYIPMSYLSQWAIYPNELFIPMSYISQWAIYP